MTSTDPRAEIKEFLSSRRARLSPQDAGLPAYGGRRRVPGLRREEVALLAGVSVDYYVRMERGALSGASDSVLDALATALQLDQAEREHLYALARRSGHARSRPPRQVTTVRPALQQLLDAFTEAPAWIRNGRHDVLAMNALARSLYSPVLADPRRPANTTRFVYLHPESAREFFVDYDQIAIDAAAMLSSRRVSTRTTASSLSWSGSCRPAARRSGSDGPPRMSASTAAVTNGCATRLSDSWTWTSSPWSCPVTPGWSSTSTPPCSAHRGALNHEGSRHDTSAGCLHLVALRTLAPGEQN